MEQLFNEFETSTVDMWKNKLEKDLKGITFEQLSQEDNNGIAINPFYTNDNKDVAGIVNPVFAHTDWDIFQHIIVSDAKIANTLALQQLNDGVNALAFEIKATINVAELLKDIQLPYITIIFYLKADNTSIFTKDLHNYIEQLGLNIADLNLFIVSDSFHDGIVNIDGVTYNNAGATSVTEIGAIAAQLQECLHKNKDQAIRQITITTAIDTAFYEQIAKIRAIRIISNNILKAYGLNFPIYIHAITSNVYRSHVDIYSNMLRDTLSGMAAVLGGANGITVLPFDYAIALPNSFSYRMAKNIQLLLKEESYLNKVADVSNGSYYIDHLTKSLVDKAWELFLQIEAGGGYEIAKNIIEDRIGNDAKILIEQYKSGKKTLIGVNKFHNKMETSVPTFREGFIHSSLLNIAQVLS
jgi:methylmalonyl-CoA mutase